MTKYNRPEVGGGILYVGGWVANIEHIGNDIEIFINIWFQITGRSWRWSSLRWRLGRSWRHCWTSICWGDIPRIIFNWTNILCQMLKRNRYLEHHCTNILFLAQQFSICRKVMHTAYQWAPTGNAQNWTTTKHHI